MAGFNFKVLVFSMSCTLVSSWVGTFDIATTSGFHSALTGIRHADSKFVGLVLSHLFVLYPQDVHV